MDLWERLFWCFYAVCMFAIAGIHAYKLYQGHKEHREFQDWWEKEVAKRRVSDRGTGE